jgi:hypothetical protein
MRGVEKAAWRAGELAGKVVFIFVGSYFGVYVVVFFFSISYCSGRFAAME